MKESRYAKFREEATGKLGGLTREQFVEKNPGVHVWVSLEDYKVCFLCGVIKRKDGKNKPCKGISRIITKSKGEK